MFTIPVLQPFASIFLLATALVCAALIYLYGVRLGIHRKLAACVPMMPVAIASEVNAADVPIPDSDNVGDAHELLTASFVAIPAVGVSVAAEDALPGAPVGQRVGHYIRPIPEGYKETMADHFENHLQDPNLNAYYDKLSLLIHGDLNSPQRLSEIIAFNLGRYDSYLRNYALSQK